jgi:NCS1 family nucleobase:cation symporter-1
LERLGIEHVDKERRHGRPFSTFTLWFGANLTIADFALGSLLFGLPLSSIVIAVVIGNIAGGLLVGLMASMGPNFGYPQMMISRTVMGSRGNIPFALANWVSTVGWFTVNIVLGGYALQLAFGIPFYVAAGILVIADVGLAIYGHDVIHLFERIMSIVLGVMFAALAVIAYFRMGNSLAIYNSHSSFSIYFWALVLAAVFSYIMSWAPYASDYSRYLPENTSKFKIITYTTAGGAIASAWAELVGFFVYVGANNPGLGAIAALKLVSGPYALLALLAVVLGVMAADALNLYTNSLSALVLYRKAGRMRTVLLAGIIGFLLALVGSSNFSTFYQNFLLTLDYWITPWIGVMMGGILVCKIRPGVETVRGYIGVGLGSYLIGLLASLPFMNLESYGIAYVGPVAASIGGADLSYFVAFMVALAAYVLLMRWLKEKREGRVPIKGPE